MSEPSTTPLDNLVNSLTQAWRRLLLYPEGHPERMGAIEQPFQVLRGLIAVTGGFELGVAAEELVVGGTSLTSLAAQELAHALYQHNVAIVAFDEGLTQEELMKFLLVLRPQRTDSVALKPEGPSSTHLQELLTAEGVANIRIETVDYRSMIGEGTDRETRLSRPRALWTRILRLLLGHEAASERSGTNDLERVLEVLRLRIPEAWREDPLDSLPPEHTEIVEGLARSISEHLGLSSEGSGGGPSHGGGQVGTGDGQARALLQALPTMLRVATLEITLRDLTARDLGRKELRALQSAAPVDDLVAALRRLRNQGLLFAGPGLELAWRLTSLQSQEQSPQRRKALAERADSSSDLLEEDADRLPQTLVDVFVHPVPEARPAAATAGEIPAQAEEDRHSAERRSLAPREVLQRLLATLVALLNSGHLDESATVATLVRVEAVARELVLGRYPQAALSLILHLRDLRERWSDRATGKSVEESLERLASDDMAQVVIEALRVTAAKDFGPYRHLAETLGATFAESMILALTEIEDRSSRRQLMSFLESMPAREVGPHAVRLLDDSRWYVARNMVALLNGLDHRSAAPAIRPLLAHRDHRVRAEALRYLGRLDPDLPASAIEPLLDDDDARRLGRSIGLLGHFQVRAAVMPLLAIAGAFDPLGRRRAVRLRAVVSLGQIGDPVALAPLASYFGTGVGRHTLEERRVAYESLAGYPAQARSAVVEKGLGHRDASIRSICVSLARPAEVEEPPTPDVSAPEDDDG